jgi:CHAT domain-containing protein
MCSKGEAVLSLREAFHQAGARHVVASLWQVDDRETLTLMILFYDRLWNGGLPPAEALRKAQLSLYRRPDLIRLAENPIRLLAARQAPTAQHAKVVAQSRIGDWAAFSISLTSWTGLKGR